MTFGGLHTNSRWNGGSRTRPSSMSFINVEKKYFPGSKGSHFGIVFPLPYRAHFKHLRSMRGMSSTMVFEKLPRDTPLLAQPEPVAYPGHGPMLTGISFLDSKTPPSLCARSDNEHMRRLGRTCPHRRVVLRSRL